PPRGGALQRAAPIRRNRCRCNRRADVTDAEGGVDGSGYASLQILAVCKFAGVEILERPGGTPMQCTAIEVSLERHVWQPAAEHVGLVQTAACIQLHRRDCGGRSALG